MYFCAILYPHLVLHDLLAGHPRTHALWRRRRRSVTSSSAFEGWVLGLINFGWCLEFLWFISRRTLQEHDDLNRHASEKGLPNTSETIQNVHAELAEQFTCLRRGYLCLCMRATSHS
ncbi:hypothetical protein BC834DRAFT_461735 [Gloeopeniophorella convolvens]|nr:hypothetical protein BC834DRAFT_461735 [Gloeopeniophorella convolvens]